MIVLLFLAGTTGNLHFGLQGKVGGDYGSYVPDSSKTHVGGILEFSIIGWYENTGAEGTIGITSGPEVQVWLETIITKNLSKEGDGKLLGIGLGYYGAAGGSPGAVFAFQYQMLRGKWINIIPQLKGAVIYGRNDGKIRYIGELLIGIALVN